MAAPPDGFPFGFLKERGLDTVVSLVGVTAYDPTPLGKCSFELEDLRGGSEPRNPAAEGAEVARAVSAVSELIRKGHGVVVHCRMGVGRTGLVLGAFLVANGHHPDKVTTWLDDVQKARGVGQVPGSGVAGCVLLVEVLGGELG
ncbi:protein-tyrosine phosphatase family protein [Rudaeicoccus suwonensis]